MDSKLTDAEIDRLLELEAKATPGDWEILFGGNFIRVGPPGYREKTSRTPYLSGSVCEVDEAGDEAPDRITGEFNAKLIAAARNSIRPLAEEVKRSRARIEAAPHESGCGRLYNSDTSMKFTQLPCDCWKSESNPAPIAEPRVADMKGKL